MKFIAYLLIAANVALAAYYFSTQSKNTVNSPAITKATLSNLAFQEKSVSQTENNTSITAKKTSTTQNTVKETTAIAQTNTPINATCLEISQITEPTTVTSIQSILNDNQITHSIRDEDTIIRTVYYILVGPFSSTNRTKLELKNLKADNIEYYLLPNGENKGAISLGLYGNKKSAEGEVAKFISKNYEARLEANDIYKTLYFIDIEPQSVQKLTDNIWNNLLSNFSSIKKSKKDC